MYNFMDQRQHKAVCSLSVWTLITETVSRVQSSCTVSYLSVFYNQEVGTGCAGPLSDLAPFLCKSMSPATPQTLTQMGKLLAHWDTPAIQAQQVRLKNKLSEFIKSLSAAPVSSTPPCGIRPLPPVRKTARWYLEDETWRPVSACVQETRHAAALSEKK